MTIRRVTIRRRGEPRPRDERGMAIIFLALFLVLLMVMAAIVVDVGNARQQRSEAQSAVDGAALSAAQVLLTNQPSQATNVFNLAASTAYNSMFLHHAIAAPSGTCAANGSSLVPPAVCNDYTYASNGVAYDVQVTTPFIGPGESIPDTSELNVKTCWSVPTVFGRVIGQNSIPICATATAQNGVGSGGPSNGGCGTQSELSNITDNFALGTPPYTIKATYNTTGTTGLPIDTTKIFFVVQNPTLDFTKIPVGPAPNGVAGQSYGMSTTGGNNVTISYTLPATINPNGSAYSNTFSANLQVTDIGGRNCGNASWSTCNGGSQFKDPIFDGGSNHDTGGNGWGLDGKRSTMDDTSDNDGHDLNGLPDSDDTVTPPQGSVITAGKSIGAVYNDEWPLRAASVTFMIDGANVAYDPLWNPGTLTFTNPQTMTSNGSGTPGVVTSMPAFGSVDATVSTAKNSGNQLVITLFDRMSNPMAGEKVTVTNTAGSPTTALDGTASFAFPPVGSQTVNYSGPKGTGSFTINVTLNNGNPAVGSKTPATVGGSPWPPNGATNGVGGQLGAWGDSVGVMVKTPASMANGWHSAVLWANDGDVNSQGGDCSIITWAFGSTGGTGGGSSIHLIT